jgi:multiple sugar transport system permease protein
MPRWTTVLLFMSPWIIGFSVFIVYPMVSSLYFSFTHYDCWDRRSGWGSRTTSTLFTEDILFWKAIKNTVWFIHRLGSAPRSSSHRHGDDR